MSFSKLYPISPEDLPTIHTSVMLRRIIDNAPPDYFTFEWLISSMPNRSYGIIILFLGLLSFVPIFGDFARLIIIVFAVQIILGFRSPALPRRIMMRRLSSRHLTRLPPSTFLVLTRVEKFIRPRWSPVLGGHRLSGVIVFCVCLVSLLVPLPFSNVPAAAIVVLTALAYLEHDGLLLVIAQIAGLAMLGLVLVVSLGTIYW